MEGFLLTALVALVVGFSLGIGFVAGMVYTHMRIRRELETTGEAWICGRRAP